VGAKIKWFDSHHLDRYWSIKSVAIYNESKSSKMCEPDRLSVMGVCGP